MIKFNYIFYIRRKLRTTYKENSTFSSTMCSTLKSIQNRIKIRDDIKNTDVTDGQKI